MLDAKSWKMNGLAVMVASVCMQAHAEEAVDETVVNLSQVVVTASGFGQAIKDAPASISVISGAQLTDKPITGLGGALQDVEGVSVERGGKSGGANISIRGLPSDYTLIMIDGKRLSQNSRGARPNGFGDVDSNFIPPMSAIEQIEVVRGPMSTLYGSDAMGGVVNIITKKVPAQWGGEFNIGWTEPQKTSKFASKMNTSLYAAGPLIKETLGLAIMAGYDHAGNAKGKFPKNAKEVASGDYTGQYNQFSGLGKRKNYNYGAKLSFTPDAQNDIILNYERGVQRFDNNEEQLGTLNSSVKPNKKGQRVGGGYSDELKFTRDRLSLSHQGRYDAVTVDSAILWDQTKTLGRINPLSAKPVPYDGTPRDIKYTNIIVDNKWMFGLGDHFITAGGQYKHQKLTDGLASAPLDVKQWQWALFVEDEWSVSDAFIATFGLRYDKNEDFGSHFSPRIYLTWNVDDAWQVKGGVSRAFRAPDLQLMRNDIVGYGRQGALPLVGNPDLKPETSTSAELGVYFDNQANFSANATLFYTKFKDKINTETKPSGQIAGIDLTGFAEAAQYRNVDDAKVYGIEAGMRYRMIDNVVVSLNYTYTDSSFKNESDRKIPFSETPKHMLNAKVNWDINDAWSTWLDGEYRAKQYQGLTDAGAKVYYKPYAIMNFGAKYQVNEQLSFSAGIDNLLNKNFADYQAPRIASKRTDFTNRYRRLEEGRRFWVTAKYIF